MKKITKIDKNKIYRIIVQVLFLIFLPGLITLAFSQAEQMFLNLAQGNYSAIIPNCITFIILSVLTIIAGRIFCGWMCIFGSLNDWIYIISNRVFKIKYKMNENADKYLKSIKYLILIFIITFVWTGIITLPPGSSPWDAYTQIFDLNYMFSEYLIGTLILLLIIIGAIFIERFFCRYLCPLGAIFSVLSKLKIYKVHKPSLNCGSCKACSLKCSMGINLNKVEKVNSGECIQCFNCVKICPKNNAKVKVLNEEINESTLATVAIITTVGVYSLANVTKNVLENNVASNINIVQKKDSTNETTNNTESSDSSSTTNNTENSVSNTTTSTTENNTSNTVTTTNQKYKDGTYTGTARGYRPGLTVSVTIKNDKITVIELVSSDETPGFYETAAKIVPNEIIKSQSTDVDIVSGATRTSNGIMNAVDSALSKALN